MASLWDRMGGEEKIRPLCDDLYLMHSTDPITAPWFGGVPGSAPGKGLNKEGNCRTAEEVKANVLGFFSAGIGGPIPYKGNDMKTAHMHMSFPKHVFHALTNHVLVGMEKHKTGGREELDEVHGILMSLKADVMYGSDKMPTKRKAPPEGSLWERMGGEEKIRPLCNELYHLHSTDPLSAPWFAGKPGAKPGEGTNTEGNRRTADEVKENVFTFFSSGIGGPHQYAGNDMKKAHMHMDIAPSAFHALTNHVMVGMEKHKTGGADEREEVYEILMSLKADVLAGTESKKKTSDEFGGLLPAGATPANSFATMCLYAGQKPDPTTGSRIAPIHMNTGFVFKNTDDAAAKFALQAFGPIYTRIGNPTCDALEAKIAALEGGMGALSVSSGHAAQFICFTNLLNSGDNFVATKQLYGGSVTQFGRQFAQFGWQVRWADCDDYDALEKAIDDKTKAVYCESICNPGGVVTDLEKLAAIAHKHGLPLIVDNTTATPYLCRPFEHGADIVLHSATKYLSGHGNSLCGFIVEKGDFNWGTPKFPVLSAPCDSYHGMKFYDVFGKDGPVAGMFGTQGKTGIAFTVGCRALGLRDCGPCLSPINAFTTSMGMETLPLRMDKHCANALAVAEFLENHQYVASVSYAGLKSSKYNALAPKYCPKGASGLFTFSCKGGFEAAKKVVNGVKMISLIANLGDTRTLIAHPASMMHSQLTEEQQKAAGADPSVLRMTIGIEDVHSITDDLDQAIKAAHI